MERAQRQKTHARQALPAHKLPTQPTTTGYAKDSTTETTPHATSEYQSTEHAQRQEIPVRRELPTHKLPTQPTTTGTAKDNTTEIMLHATSEYQSTERAQQQKTLAQPVP